MGTIDVTTERVGDRTTVRVGGEIDMASSPALDAALQAAANQAGQVLVDIRNVRFMDSTGLSTLVRAHNSIGEAFSVVCGAGPVRRVLAVSGVDQVLRVVEDVAELGD